MKYLLMFLLASVPLQVLAWQVEKITGEASVQRAGIESPLIAGAVLNEEDLISTGPQARVLLRDGGSEISLGGHTKFKIHGAEKASPGSQATINLVYGKLRAVVAKPEAKKYQFRTRVAVAGVRGTEFFMSSDESADLICTLEGSVEVRSDSGPAYTVDKGKGLRLASGQRGTVSDNSPALVDRWIAETSFDVTPPVAEDSYSTELIRHALDGEAGHWYAGGFGHVFYCDSKNRDFDRSKADADNSCVRSYLSPFLQYQAGQANKLFVRPAIVSSANGSSKQIDDVPFTVRRGETELTIAEAYGETGWENWTIRLGFQQVEWADGVLLSKKLWSDEPVTHLALDARRQFGNWNLELLGGPGVADREALRGHSHISTLGAKTDLPRNWGSLYVLHADFGDLQPGLSPAYHGHELMNYGLYSTRKIRSFDYTASAIYQKHAIHHTMSGMAGKAEGVMTDVTLGYQLPVGQPLRISLRFASAGKNFIPVLEDYYALGLGRVVATRGNLEQRRAKLEWEPHEQNLFSLEYIENRELSDSGFIRQLSSAGSYQFIGTEWDLLYSIALSPRWRVYAGGWRFVPGGNSAAHDPATGWMSRVEFTY